MTRHEHLLTIAAEECMEVAHRISKILRFGLHDVQDGHTEDNMQRLIGELNDLSGAIEMLEDQGIIPKCITREAVSRKKAKIEIFLGLSEKNGRLQ